MYWFTHYRCHFGDKLPSQSLDWYKTNQN